MPSVRFHESMQRGRPEFPLEYYHLDNAHPRYEMSFHWHEEVEWIRVLHGSFELSLDEESYTLHEGDIAFIASGQLHGGKPQNAEYECIVGDMRFLLKMGEGCRQCVNDVVRRRVKINPVFARDDVLFRDAELLFDAMQCKRNGGEAQAVGCLYLFFGDVFATHAFIEEEAQDDCRRVLQLKLVFELIERDYASQLTLRQLADCVHMTPKYFCRFFKQAVHRTPMDYLNYYRVENACFRLAATDCNVTEAALDVGFNDIGYFIRCFKRFKGETPGKYAARMRKK